MCMGWTCAVLTEEAINETVVAVRLILHHGRVKKGEIESPFIGFSRVVYFFIVGLFLMTGLTSCKIIAVEDPIARAAWCTLSPGHGVSSGEKQFYESNMLQKREILRGSH